MERHHENDKLHWYKKTMGRAYCTRRKKANACLESFPGIRPMWGFCTERSRPRKNIRLIIRMKTTTTCWSISLYAVEGIESAEKTVGSIFSCCWKTPTASQNLLESHEWLFIRGFYDTSQKLPAIRSFCLLLTCRCSNSTTETSTFREVFPSWTHQTRTPNLHKQYSLTRSSGWGNRTPRSKRVKTQETAIKTIVSLSSHRASTKKRRGRCSFGTWIPPKEWWHLVKVLWCC